MLSHHAHLLIGDEAVRSKLLSELVKKQKIKIKGNPDFSDRKYETFTIDDARELKSSAGTKPVNESGKKIFLLTMNGITVEAQNALLKLLEEPPEYAHFFLIIPSAHLLLPTVRSRMSDVTTILSDSATIAKYSGAKKKDDLTSEISKMTKIFVTSSTKQRLDIIKSLMDDISKEKKTKQDAINFLNSIEASIHEKDVKKNIAALEAIETARRYMNDRAPSMKMLLEYVAMSI